MFMEKSLIIILIIIGFLVGIILLDTIQALIFNNNPIIGIETHCRSKVGILVDTYHCGNGKNVTKFKTASSCPPPPVCDNDINYSVAEIDNVGITISDISLTGATITIKDTNEIPYVYGEWYIIQKQDNDKWYNLSTLIDNYAFNEIGYLVNDEKEVKFDIDWKWLYGELSSGSYRILKQVDDKYISVEFDIANTLNTDNKIEVVKSSIQNLNKYNIYLERDGRIIYLSSSLVEVYFSSNGNKVALKEYISKTWQTADDGMKHLTDLMEDTATLKDGGTKIYKSKVYDITIIKCNRLSGNRDYFIGDYNMLFDNEAMCNR